MGTSSWTDFLDNPEALQDLYGRTVPRLDSCDLFFLLADERQNSITVGFSTTDLPQHTPSESNPGGFNSLEFYLTFIEISEMSMQGWKGPGQRRVEINYLPTGNLAVGMKSEGSNLRFVADSVSVTKIRTSLTSPY
ncbi:Imm50 family immunity protein [Streptomyces sp. NPDC093109]|uniref:Imm50 family immunity protein n=1 Tax=Streptomyces sp. NPDC093109 TaxID=3154977 RepID=UPI00344D768A